MLPEVAARAVWSALTPCCLLLLNDGCGRCWICGASSEGEAADPMAATLQIRQAVRQAVMSGQIAAAIDLLQQQCPAALQGSAVADEVQFHLSCQQYIELIR
jgi:hypothetical protein